MSTLQYNAKNCNYRAVVDLETCRRVLGYRPSLAEAQNLANERSAGLAYVEKRYGTSWRRIED